MQIWIPENFAPYATPTAQWEFGTAAISPAHLVPWWFESEIISMKSSYIILVLKKVYQRTHIYLRVLILLIYGVSHKYYSDTHWYFKL